MKVRLFMRLQDNPTPVPLGECESSFPCATPRETQAELVRVLREAADAFAGLDPAEFEVSDDLHRV